jgi:hypothetical protein
MRRLKQLIAAMILKTTFWGDLAAAAGWIA